MSDDNKHINQKQKGLRVFKLKKKLEDPNYGYYYFDNSGQIDDADKDLFLNEKIYPANPDTKNNTRNCYMVIGKSGAGKSVLTADYICHYYDKVINPKSQQMFIISPKTYDPAFNKYTINRPALNERNFVNPETKLIFNDFVFDEDGNQEPSALIIFDDVEGIHNNKVRDGVLELMNSCLVNARSVNISVVCIVHNPFLKCFKTALLECNWVCFFPQSINQRIFDKFLYDHMGLLRGDRKVLKDIKARHLFINQNQPIALTPFSAHII